MTAISIQDFAILNQQLKDLVTLPGVCQEAVSGRTQGLAGTRQGPGTGSQGQV